MTMELPRETYEALMHHIAEAMKILNEVTIQEDRGAKAQANSPRAQVNSPKAQVNSPRAQVNSPRAQVNSPKAQVKAKAKAKSKAKAKEDWSALHLAPFDPEKCRRRWWRGDGYNCQCPNAIYENRLCKSDFKQFETKGKCGDHGMYDEEIPAKHSFRDADGNKPVKGKPKGPYDSLKVSELKEKLKAKNLETSGKKPELIERLVEADKADKVAKPEAPVAEVEVGEVAEVAEVAEVEVAEVAEVEVGEVAEAEVDGELERDETEEDEEEESYDTIDYQGVEYLTKGDLVYNTDFEEIGTWDGHVVDFTNVDAEARHNEDRDEYEGEDDD
jgi:hypothetical protein